MAFRAVFTGALLVAAALATIGDAIALPFTARFVRGAPRVDPSFNINSGGKANSRFLGDNYDWIVGNTSFYDDVDAVIGGAEEKNKYMYRSHRYGAKNSPEWGYDVPVKAPGTYGCTVHFTETYVNAFSNGSRVFDLSIKAEGKPIVFKGIDVFKDTGGAKFTVYTRTAPKLVVTNGISFRVKKLPTSKQPAFISGITCERTGELPAGTSPEIPVSPRGPNDPIPTALKPVTAVGKALTGGEININAGYKAIGRFMAEDKRWFSYGPSTVFVLLNQPIGGADAINNQSLWSHRYGINGSSFGYNIPVKSPGVWECTLHWAEIDSGKKVGDRVFDVQLQDRMFSNIDVLKGTGSALFTSFTKTFTDVPIANSLVIKLMAKKGDAMLSSITCAKNYNVTSAAAAALLSARADGTAEVSLEPVPVVTPVAATPVTVPIPTSTPTVVPDASTSAVPSTDPAPLPSVAVDPVPSSSQIESTPPIPEVTPGPVTVNASDVLLSDITLDAKAVPSADQVLQTVELLLKVPADTDVNNELKEMLKNVTATGSQTDMSAWAVTAMNATTVEVVTKALTTEPSSFQVDCQVPLDKKTGLDQVNNLTRYLQLGDGTKQLQTVYPDAEIDILRLPNTDAFVAAAPASTATKTSTIVAAVVGTVIGILVIVAVLAFFVIYRHRRNEPSEGDFNAPPPDMSGSEARSSAARSENAGSVDYLDDDSTFTAATSRAGDPEAGVTLDKDVWGRGSS